MTGLLRVTDAVHAGQVTLADLHPGARLVALRALVLGTAAAGVGTASHVAGDGLLPSPAALVVLFAAAVGVASVLVLTRATRTRIVVALVGGQALMHVVLASLGGHRGVNPEQGGFWAHQVQHLTAAGPGMVMAHTVGAVALGLFLACAEQRLWVWLVRRVLATHLVALVGLSRLTSWASEVAPTWHDPTPAHRESMPTPVQTRPRWARRGPPVLLAAG